MAIYFAKLSGDMVGIDHYIRFEAADESSAQEFADEKAKENYEQYDDESEDGEGMPNYGADVELWDDTKHEQYVGDACFTDHYTEKGGL